MGNVMGRAERDAARKLLDSLLPDDPEGRQLDAIETERIATAALDTADALAEDVRAILAMSRRHPSLTVMRRCCEQHSANLVAYDGPGAERKVRCLHGPNDSCDASCMEDAYRAKRVTRAELVAALQLQQQFPVATSRKSTTYSTVSRPKGVSDGRR